MHSRKVGAVKKALSLLAVSSLFLTSCGMFGSSAEAKPTLVDALRNLLATESYTQTMSLDSDVESLVAISEGEMSEEIAQTILDASIVASGKQADDPTKAESELLLNLGGSDSLEMRFVEGDLYFRADVATLVETFGGNPADIDAAVAQIKSQPGFDWVEPAAAGEWIVVRDALQLSQQMGGTAVSPEQQQELIDDLLQTVEQNATVTDEGEDDAGQHLRASMPLQETIQDLMQSLGPAAGMMQGQDMMGDIPDENIVLDFWVTDETITQMAIDFTQFEGMSDGSGDEFPEGVERLSFVIAIEETDVNVEPVTGAVELDTAALTQALSGLMGGGGLGTGGGGGTGSFDCNALKGAPPEVIELYAEECPELQP